MISDPLFCALATLAIPVTGIAKLGFGGAMGGLAVSPMSLVIPSAEAAGVMLPALAEQNLIQLRSAAAGLSSVRLSVSASTFPQ